MELRGYQLTATQSCVAYLKKCLDPCLVVIGTGGGKSIVISAIANDILRFCGDKKILILAHREEILLSNHEAFESLTGKKAGIYSAGLKIKQLRHQVTVASPATIVKSLGKLHDYCAVLVDEPANMPPTYRKIVDYLQEKNGGSLRVVGFDATPFTLASGYTYEIDENGKKEPETLSPYFKKKICDFSLEYLIENGYNLPPVFGAVSDDAEYDLKGISGKITAKQSHEVFDGQRTTSVCMQDIVEKTANRHSVLIFAQTIQHGKECIESLPAGSQIITGDTKNRTEIIEKFKNFEFKYLVNVEVLTVGTNIPSIDAICFVRYTDSIKLYIQMVGRGSRLFSDIYQDGTTKKDCLILDYTQNLTRHFPNGDFYSPKIEAPKKKKEKSERIHATCESCNYTNLFAARDNPSMFPIDDNGYFCNALGQRITINLSDEKTVSIPAHFGRRCEGEAIKKGRHERCTGRWSFKLCKHCNEQNDIAAKYCISCGGEIINPNDRLTEDAQTLTAKTFNEPLVADIVWTKFESHTSAKNNKMLKIKMFVKSKPHHLQFFIYSKHQLKPIPQIVGWVDNPEFFEQFKNIPKPTKVTFKKAGKGYYEILSLI